MDYRTEQLILRAVSEGDLAEVARTWPSDHRPVSEAEAQAAILNMRRNANIPQFRYTFSHITI